VCGIGHHRWQAGVEIGADLNPHGQADPDKLESSFDYGGKLQDGAVLLVRPAERQDALHQVGGPSAGQSPTCTSQSPGALPRPEREPDGHSPAARSCPALDVALRPPLRSVGRRVARARWRGVSCGRRADPSSPTVSNSSEQVLDSSGRPNISMAVQFAVPTLLSESVTKTPESRVSNRSRNCSLRSRRVSSACRRSLQPPPPKRSLGKR